jgi:hypothetical protein
LSGRWHGARSLVHAHSPALSRSVACGKLAHRQRARAPEAPSLWRSLWLWLWLWLWFWLAIALLPRFPAFRVLEGRGRGHRTSLESFVLALTQKLVSPRLPRSRTRAWQWAERGRESSFD